MKVRFIDNIMIIESFVQQVFEQLLNSRSQKLDSWTYYKT